MSISRYKSVFLQSLHVALDREDRDLSGRAAQDLVGHSFGTGKRRLKLHRLAVLLFPFRGEARKDRFLQRFLHDRETVERDRDVAAFGWWFGQTTSSQQRHDKRRYC